MAPEVNALLFKTGAVSAVARVSARSNIPRRRLTLRRKWKLNPDKSKLADQMTIAPAGENKYTLTFAGAGETETLIADGTDQAGISGTTASITVVGPGDWKFVRKHNGQGWFDSSWSGRPEPNW